MEQERPLLLTPSTFTIVFGISFHFHGDQIPSNKKTIPYTKQLINYRRRIENTKQTRHVTGFVKKREVAFEKYS